MSNMLLQMACISLFLSEDFLFDAPPPTPPPKKNSQGRRSSLRGSCVLGPRRPIHLAVKWLSSHTRTRSAKFGGAPYFMNCCSSELYHSENGQQIVYNHSVAAILNQKTFDNTYFVKIVL